MTRTEILEALETRFAVFNTDSFPYGFDEFGAIMREAFFVRDGAVWRVLCSKETFDGECSMAPWESFTEGFTPECWAAAPAGCGEPRAAIPDHMDDLGAI